MSWNLPLCSSMAQSFSKTEYKEMEFPGGTVGKKTPAKAGSSCLVPGPGGVHMPGGNEARGCAQVPKPACSRAQAPPQEKPRNREA